MNMTLMIAFIVYLGALIGFGLDSVVESLSGVVLIWRLRQHGNLSDVEEEKRETKAIRFVAVTFFILGVYITVESVRKLVGDVAPEPSLAGVIIAAVFRRVLGKRPIDVFGR